ncbi:MAG: 3-methyl-2-oxobutanoate hydroxymethyltransferase [Bacteroidales bacterium]
MAGFETTLPITLDNMIYHAAGGPGHEPGLVVVDLPFGTYQEIPSSPGIAIRIMKETGASAIKLEGASKSWNRSTASCRRASRSWVTSASPQAIHKFGTCVVRATESEEAEKLKSDAIRLAQAGCFAIVLEKIPAKLAGEVSRSIAIPTIGIGAGREVDGQVLVLHDMLGITQEFSPRFLRRYHNLQMEVKGAVSNYIEDVRSRNFPNESESY